MGIRDWSWEALDAVEKENKEERINRWEVGGRWEAEERLIELSPTEYLTGPSNSTCVKQKRLVPKSYLLFPSSVDVTIFPHILASSQPVILLFTQVFLIPFFPQKPIISTIVPSKYFLNPLTFLHPLCYQSCLHHHCTMPGLCVTFPTYISKPFSTPWPQCLLNHHKSEHAILPRTALYLASAY